MHYIFLSPNHRCFFNRNVFFPPQFRIFHKIETPYFHALKAMILRGKRHGLDPNDVVKQRLSFQRSQKRSRSSVDPHSAQINTDEEELAPFPDEGENRVRFPLTSSCFLCCHRYPGSRRS